MCLTDSGQDAVMGFNYDGDKFFFSPTAADKLNCQLFDFYTTGYVFKGSYSIMIS
jgi:hypothetical protein